MVDAIDNDPRTFGERVASSRRRGGMSQADLAKALSKSESWVSQVERDILPVERISVLHALADALGASILELKPEAGLDAAPAPERFAELELLRLTLTGHPTPDVLGDAEAAAETPISADDIRSRVDAVWGLAEASMVADASEALAALVPDLERAVRAATGRQQQELLHLLGRTYEAAAACLARYGEADAAWLAADRALAAAERSRQPLGVFAAQLRMAHAFVALGQLEQAEHVVAASVTALTPLAAGDAAAPEAQALLGATYLAQAVIGSRGGDRATARAAVKQARSLAARLGDGRNDFNTEFGPTSVELQAISTAVDLGDAGEALELADALDVASLSSERRSRLHIDLARAHAQRRRTADALAALLAAEDEAPEYVAGSEAARATARDLLSLAGRRPPNALAALARRIGVAV